MNKGSTVQLYVLFFCDLLVAMVIPIIIVATMAIPGHVLASVAVPKTRPIISNASTTESLFFSLIICLLYLFCVSLHLS
jgi:hypothetical protein